MNEWKRGKGKVGGEEPYLFGVPGVICPDPGVEQGQTTPDDIGQIIPHQFSHLVPLRQERHQSSSQDPGDQERDDLDAAHVVPPREIGAADGGYSADGAGRDGEEGGRFAAVAEVVDEGRLVGGDGAVGDEGGDGNEAEEEGLWIGEAFHDLGWFELRGH